MSFIKRIVGPDERLVGLCTVHWVYGARGLAWLAGFMLLGLVLQRYLLSLFSGATPWADIPQFTVLGPYVFWTCTAIGGLLFWFSLLVMISTEVALTTKRIIFKHGLIAVDVREVDLEEIKAATVNNGWFGRFFNYGYLMLDARFIGDLIVPAVHDPYRLLKALNDQRARLRGESLEVILNEEPDLARKAQEEKSHAHLDDPAYRALSDNPVSEFEQAVGDMAVDSDASEPRRSVKIRHLRPVVYSKVGLRDKVKSSFHMIAHYGNKY